MIKGKGNILNFPNNFLNFSHTGVRGRGCFIGRGIGDMYFYIQLSSN